MARQMNILQIVCRNSRVFSGGRNHATFSLSKVKAKTVSGDDTTIATSDITVGSGKTLDVSSGTLTLADNQISGDKVEGGTIASTTITTLTSTTGNITNVNATTTDTENIEVTNLKARDGTSVATIADSTGKITIGDSVLTTTDINGGTIDISSGTLNLVPKYVINFSHLCTISLCCCST